MKKFFTLCACALLSMVSFAQLNPATFEGIQVGENGVFYDPELNVGGNVWTDGGFTFTTYYDNGYGDYYSDIVVSSVTDPTMVADYTNPVSYLSAASTTTAEGNNFAVWNMNYYGVAPVLVAKGTPLTGMYVNNTSALVNYLTGTYTSFPADGWFKLIVTGKKASAVTGTVEFYLVDWRDAANKVTVTDWQWLDLSTLGEVDELNFDIDSNDKGEYGINAPAYFCFDNLGGEAPAQAITNTTATQARKMMVNGQMMIRRGNANYTLTGAKK